MRPKDLPGDGNSRRLKRTNPVILNELWGEGASRGDDTYVSFFSFFFFFLPWYIWGPLLDGRL